MNVNADKLIDLLQENYTTIEVVFESEAELELPQPQNNARIDPAGLWGGPTIPRAPVPPVTRRPKTYTYKAPLVANVKEGDFVIVHNGDEFGIARVVKVHDVPKIDVNASFRYKWIVQRVDTSSYLEQMAREEEFRESLRHAERVNARESMVRQALEGLPEDAPGRELFQAAVDSFRKTFERAPAIAAPVKPAPIVESGSENGHVS